MMRESKFTRATMAKNNAEPPPFNPHIIVQKLKGIKYTTESLVKPPPDVKIGGRRQDLKVKLDLRNIPRPEIPITAKSNPSKRPKPNAAAKMPVYQQTMVVNQSRKGGNEPPKGGNQLPKEGNQPSRVGNQPRKVENQPPRVGNQPTKVGNEPTQVGNQPPRLGNQPPNVRNQPPTKLKTELPNKSKADLPNKTKPNLLIKTKPDQPNKAKPSIANKSKPDLPNKTKPDTPTKSKRDLPDRTKPDTPTKSKRDLPDRTKPDTPNKSKRDLPDRTKPDTPNKTKRNLPNITKADRIKAELANMEEPLPLPRAKVDLAAKAQLGATKKGRLQLLNKAKLEAEMQKPPPRKKKFNLKKEIRRKVEIRTGGSGDGVLNVDKLKYRPLGPYDEFHISFLSKTPPPGVAVADYVPPEGKVYDFRPNPEKPIPQGYIPRSLVEKVMRPKETRPTFFQLTEEPRHGFNPNDDYHKRMNTIANDNELQDAKVSSNDPPAEGEMKADEVKPKESSLKQIKARVWNPRYSGIKPKKPPPKQIRQSDFDPKDWKVPEFTRNKRRVPGRGLKPKLEKPKDSTKTDLHPKEENETELNSERDSKAGEANPMELRPWEAKSKELKNSGPKVTEFRVKDPREIFQESKSVETKPKASQTKDSKLNKSPSSELRVWAQKQKNILAKEMKIKDPKSEPTVRVTKFSDMKRLYPTPCESTSKEIKEWDVPPMEPEAKDTKPKLHKAKKKGAKKTAKSRAAAKVKALGRLSPVKDPIKVMYERKVRLQRKNAEKLAKVRELKRSPIVAKISESLKRMQSRPRKALGRKIRQPIYERATGVTPLSRKLNNVARKGKIGVAVNTHRRVKSPNSPVVHVEAKKMVKGLKRQKKASPKSKAALNDVAKF